MVQSLALVCGVIALIIGAFFIAGLFFEDPELFVLRRLANLIHWLKFWN